MWSCPNCRAKVDSSFEVCWSCGTSSDGAEDPAFVRADDVTQIADPPGKLDQGMVDDPALELAAPPIEVVACYWARHCAEAKFLADQLVQDGIPAAADSYDLRIVFAGFFGLVPAGPYFGPRVWVLAEDLPRVRSWLGDYEQRRRAKRKSRRP